MPWLKQIHIALALVSLSGFAVRGYWMMRGSPLLKRQWVRVVPHFVDTLLLVTGLSLVFTLSLYPGEQTWLTAKLVALVLYILLGTVALKRGRTYALRTTAFVAALAVFTYMAAVAVTHRPLPLFS